MGEGVCIWARFLSGRELIRSLIVIKYRNDETIYIYMVGNYTFKCSFML